MLARERGHWLCVTNHCVVPGVERKGRRQKRTGHAEGPGGVPNRADPPSPKPTLAWPR